MPRKTTPKVDLPDLAALEAELMPLTPNQLRRRFFEAAPLGAHRIAEAAVCVKLLKAKGADITGIPMASTFLQIADGRLDLASFLRSIGSPTLGPIKDIPSEKPRKVAQKPIGDNLSINTRDYLDGESAFRRFMVMLPAEEFQALRINAVHAGLSVTEMARHFLAQAGAFRQPKVPARPARKNAG